MIEFLYEHLEQFGDSREAISSCLDYVFSDEPGKGGFILVAVREERMAGMLVMIFSGMEKYIPANFLVYLATDSSCAPLGLGADLIEESKNYTKGDIALHVEGDNSAKKLYKHLGFTHKYYEMRYSPEK